MDCIKKEFVRTDADGHKWWRVVLTATEAPDSLQLTGADVDGMDDNIRFEAGSVLLTPDGNYIAFEDGNFSGEGGGGGAGGTVTLINNTGGSVEQAVAYADSIEAALNNNMTVFDEIAEGATIEVELPYNGVLMAMYPAALSVVSGDIESKVEPMSQMYYIEVHGDGVAEIILEA